MITASTKTDLRKLYLLRRERVARNHPEFEKALNDGIFSWLSEQKAKTVGFYWPFRAEPKISPAIERWLAADSERKAALPVVEDKEKALMHYALWSHDSAMHIGAYGIAVPKEDIQIVPEIVFLPCVAFNAAGVRLGSGAGFFDRYLAARRKGEIPVVAVAVSFEILCCEELQGQAHDEPFEWLATEVGVRRIK